MVKNFDKLCEMRIVEHFKLSIGHIALVGYVEPSDCRHIPPSQAEVYINGKKMKAIDILGEDIFVGKNVRRDVRAVRTGDDIAELIKGEGGRSVPFG